MVWNTIQKLVFPFFAHGWLSMGSSCRLIASRKPSLSVQEPLQGRAHQGSNTKKVAPNHVRASWVDQTAFRGPLGFHFGRFWILVQGLFYLPSSDFPPRHMEHLEDYSSGCSTDQNVLVGTTWSEPQQPKSGFDPGCYLLVFVCSFFGPVD